MTASVPKSELRERAVGAYLGLAVGDALGATVEFLTPREIAERHGVHHEVVGGGWLRLRRGQVTDDTTMSLALGRSILDHGGVEATAVAEAFSAWMRAKPVDIGNTVRRGVIHYRQSGEPRVPENEFDAGNGACMRCLPVALFSLGMPEEGLAAALREQAHVTHHNPLSDAACLCVAAMVQAALRGEGIDALRRLAERLSLAHPPFAFLGRPMENPGGYVVETLRAVFQSLFAHGDFESALVEVVNRGGDADTTGAILGMIAGALHGTGGIPARWLRALERETRRACEEQAEALLARSPGWRARS